ncbi:hypothetical protein HRR83_004978 [Exophiala dermatitidis]|nr:hypothetical protein HRR73_003774 [Exophiala dermatitidis]KAJ4541295.1 hypothetical protein HRR77_006092 [Exophiala dermatitidis]KAJ4542822.1 hypothetical protein HRR78_006555 [Exophiala dermatitidis]KAJ4576364.1 hypothetical protein HRR82_005765 [Exophiala dermatitidis]KAJ4596427.1 hypothetical protein HRR83_004978 [Exophiala dermatitidis]
MGSSTEPHSLREHDPHHDSLEQLLARPARHDFDDDVAERGRPRHHISSATAGREAHHDSNEHQAKTDLFVALSRAKVSRMGGS